MATKNGHSGLIGQEKCLLAVHCNALKSLKRREASLLFRFRPSSKREIRDDSTNPFLTTKIDKIHSKQKSAQKNRTFQTL